MCSAYMVHAARRRCVFLINSSCRTASVRCHTHASAHVGQVGVALQLAACSVQHIGLVADAISSLYLSRPKFCTPIVLQNGSEQAKKRKKITHTLFVPSPSLFPNLGAPISTPSDRGRYMLEIQSDANSSYRHSKAVSSNGEVFANLSQKWQSCLGGWRSAPSAQSVRVTYSLYNIHAI